MLGTAACCLSFCHHTGGGGVLVVRKRKNWPLLQLTISHHFDVTGGGGGGRGVALSTATHSPPIILPQPADHHFPVMGKRNAGQDSCSREWEEERGGRLSTLAGHGHLQNQEFPVSLHLFWFLVWFGF